MTELKISKGLHVQLQRVAKVGACSLNQLLKNELSLINDHLFGFKLNTYCQTCVLDAMHKVNDHISKEQKAVEVNIEVEDHVVEISEDTIEDPVVEIAEEVGPIKTEHKSVEVYSKSFLKKKSVGELQTLADKINGTDHEPKIEEFTTKGQGVNAMAGIKKI